MALQVPAWRVDMSDMSTSPTDSESGCHTHSVAGSLHVVDGRTAMAIHCDMLAELSILIWTWLVLCGAKGAEPLALNPGYVGRGASLLPELQNSFLPTYSPAPGVTACLHELLHGK